MEHNEILRRIHDCELEIVQEIDRICTENGLKYYLFYGSLIGALRHQGFIPWDEDMDVAMPREDYETFLRIAPNVLKEKFMLDDISTNPQYFNPFAKVRNKNTVFAIRDLRDYHGNQGLWVDIFPLDLSDASEAEIAQRIRYTHRLRAGIRQHRHMNTLVGAKLRTKVLCNAIALIPDKKLWQKMKALHTAEKTGRQYVAYGSDIGDKYPKRAIFSVDAFEPARTVPFEGVPLRIPCRSEELLTRIYGDYMQIPPKEKQITFYPDWIVFEDGTKINVEADT